jgi:polyvinyl alcohol dehydrogenase (cytochrome)
VDPKRNSVYVPTGNNYEVPDSYKWCVVGANGNEEALQACALVWEDNYFDSIVALDIDTGAVKWAMRSVPYDAWNAACDREVLIPLIPGSDKNCPTPKGPDSDFAQPPMLVSVVVDGVEQDRLYAGTKGGEFFSINPDDGSVIWRKQIGPGGPLGGMEFGAASDGQRIYIQNTNFLHEPHLLTTGFRAGEIIKGGFWAALDPINGDLLWETPVPTVDLPFESACEAELVRRWGPYVCLHPVQGKNKGPGFWSFPVAPLTVANGLVFAGVADLDGTMVAMDASSGAILWEYQSGASIGSAPTIADGKVYWGIGYKYGQEGNKLLTFSLAAEE